MNPLPPSAVEPPDIDRSCERELARHGWKLAGEPVLVADGKSFAQRVHERVARLCAEEGLVLNEALVSRAVKTEYGVLLHRAVSLNGHRVQSVALEDTNREGWKVAIYKCNGDKDAAESAVYSALLKLWQHIGNVRPESYFQYFLQTLNREIMQLWRKNRRGGGGGDVPLGAAHPVRDDDSNPEERDSDLIDTGSTGESAYQGVLDDMALSSLVAALRSCLQRPRWIFVVISNFVLELNPSEIAAQLKITVGAVYIIKHRARQHVRQNCAATLLSELRV